MKFAVIFKVKFPSEKFRLELRTQFNRRINFWKKQIKNRQKTRKINCGKNSKLNIFFSQNAVIHYWITGFSADFIQKFKGESNVFFFIYNFYREFSMLRRYTKHFNFILTYINFAASCEFLNPFIGIVSRKLHFPLFFFLPENASPDLKYGIQTMRIKIEPSCISRVVEASASPWCQSHFKKSKRVYPVFVSFLLLLFHPLRLWR